LAEGGFQAGETALVVANVITSAGQVRNSAKAMRQAGLKVQDVLCVIDRQEGVREDLKEIGCSLTSLFTIEELNSLSHLILPAAKREFQSSLKGEVFRKSFCTGRCCCI
jgi:orotate phosphoribosyltransferase